MILDTKKAEKLANFQVDSNSVPVFDQHQTQVIKKHDDVIHDFRNLYKDCMSEVWNGYDRFVKLDTEFLLDSNGEKIYEMVYDKNGQVQKKYVKDERTSIFDNKGYF